MPAMTVRTDAWGARAASVCLLVLLLGQEIAFGQNPPSELVLRGQEEIYHLRYARAREIFEEARARFPNSPVGYGMLSILAWNELLFESSNFALDDYSTPSPFVKKRTRKPIEGALMRFKEANEALRIKCEEILERNPDDPSTLYFQGLVYENLAAEAIVISKKDRPAFSYGKRARQIHERVIKLDRNLVDAQISLAAHDFAAPNLPWKFRLLAFLLGMGGDEKRAFQRLRLVVDTGQYRRYDLLGLMKAWKGKREYSVEAAEVFEGLRRKFPDNFLLDLNLAAIYEKDNPKAALQIYQDLERNLASKAPGLKPGEVSFRIGRSHYRLRNYNLALQSFEKALAQSRREKETAPLCHYYRGLIHQVQGDRSRAIECFRSALEGAFLDTIERELGDAERRLRKLQGS